MRKHKTLLGKILLKFGKKVSSLQRKDVCIHNCEEKQTNIFKILRNLFTPTDQNILLILEFVHFFFPPVDTTESPCESLRYRNMHFYQRGVDTRESPNICTTTFTFSLSILRALQILGVFPRRFYHKRAKAIQSPVPDKKFAATQVDLNKILIKILTKILTSFLIKILVRSCKNL